MWLSDLFTSAEYLCDAEFETLGQSDSQHPRTLAYCDSLFHLRRADENPNVNCLLSTPELIKRVCHTQGVIACDSPRQRFFEIHRQLVKKRLLQPEMICGVGQNCKIHPTACISKSSRIGDNVEVGAYSVIHDHVDIGSDTFIDSSVQIGVEGLLYSKDQNDNILHVKHQGGVRVGSHCALLSNAVIARSVHRGLFTTIGDHCVIGIAANIGHEAQLENNVVISNHCVIARAARIAEHSHIGTSSVIREYIHVETEAQVKPGSVVVDGVTAGQAVSGNYAVSHRSNLRRHMTKKNQCKADHY